MIIKELSPVLFEKYGKVVKAPYGELPTSQANDYKFWSDIAHYSIDGETEIGVCTVFKEQQTIITAMERHLETPEILIPIDGAFVLPLLLEDEEEPEVFKVEIGEAVVVNKGVWHGACIPKDKKYCSYFVIFKHKTPFNDVEKKSVNQFEIIP